MNTSTDFEVFYHMIIINSVILVDRRHFLDTSINTCQMYCIQTRQI